MSMRASAARYAKALLDVTIAEGDPALAEQQLSAFAALLDQHANLQAALTNPAVPAAGKRAVVQQLIDRQAPSAPVGKVLLLLADRDKLSMLPDLLAVYRERLMEHQRVIRAEVTTAAPLDPARAEQLTDRLAKATGRTVRMTTKVDPAIIGGIVTRIGSTVYDGSVAAQLQAIRQRLAR
jgi:F-type H+-transporting ATPase subunit delta